MARFGWLFLNISLPNYYHCGLTNLGGGGNLQGVRGGIDLGEDERESLLPYSLIKQWIKIVPCL